MGRISDTAQCGHDLAEDGGVLNGAGGNARLVGAGPRGLVTFRDLSLRQFVVTPAS
jgi:hypothetical protein